MSRIDFVTGAPEKYAHLVDGLAKVTQELDALTAGRSDAEMRRADADAWSIQRVLAHMASYAAWQDTFIRQVATMTDPAPVAFDQTEAAEALMSSSPGELLRLVEATIGRTAKFLSLTPDASWGRPGRLRGGRRSLRQIVEAHIRHMNEHVDQTRTLLQAQQR